MRFRGIAIAAAMMAAAMPAVAQRGGGANVRGERAGDVGGRGFALPRAADMEDHSPVGVVLDKKKKLALTDSQLAAVKSIEKALHERNAEFYRQWDSVRVVMRAASGGAFGGGGGGRGSEAVTGTSPVDQPEQATARTRATALRRAIRLGDEWAYREVLKVLTPEQKAKAEGFWADDAEDFQAKLPGRPMPPWSTPIEPPGA
jgi:hypothetical protein